MLGGPQVSPHPGNESNLEEKSLLTLSEAPFTVRAAPDGEAEYKLYSNADDAIAAFLRSKHAETHQNSVEKDLSLNEKEQLKKLKEMQGHYATKEKLIESLYFQLQPEMRQKISMTESQEE